MKLLVVGAGATGGYFGARLALAYRDVTFLVRPGRAAQLRKDGLRIVSPWGNLVLTPRLAITGEGNEPVDIVLLAVKSYALNDALEDVAVFVDRRTIILPVLNGWRHIDVIRRKFGDASVVGGVCRIIGSVDQDGRIVQMTKLHELEYGELDGTSSTRMVELDKFMRGVGFDNRLSMTIDADMWEKWILLATIGAATCLVRGNVGDIATQSGGEQFLHAVLDEATAIATASGRPPRPRFLSATRELLSQRESIMTTSMYRDLMSGKPVEADAILGDLVERGVALQIPAPHLGAALLQLSIYQRKLSSA